MLGLIELEAEATEVVVFAPMAWNKKEKSETREAKLKVNFYSWSDKMWPPALERRVMHSKFIQLGISQISRIPGIMQGFMLAERQRWMLGPQLGMGLYMACAQAKANL